jgi:hypothetical protein
MQTQTRHAIGSPGGQPGSVKVRCPVGHCFSGPTESLRRARASSHAVVSVGQLPPLTMQDPPHTGDSR